MSEYSIGAIGRAEKVMFQKHLLEQNFSGGGVGLQGTSTEKGCGEKGRS